MTGSPSYETIRVRLEEEGRLLTLLLNQPKGNILTTKMMGELAAALEAHRDLPGLKAVVLAGAEHRFSFGASVEEHQKEQAPAMLSGFHAFVRKVANYPVPIAALVEGPCLGGAFELVLCCHLVFATESATFGCPEIKLGVFPPVLAAVGPHRLGGPLAEWLTLTGAVVPAKRLKCGGLVMEIFEDKASEDQFLEWFRENLGGLSAFAIRQSVKALRQGSPTLEALGKALDAAEEQYVSEVLESHDGNEGISAFLERRKPVWTDA